jgi:hypothetical protein
LAVIDDGVNDKNKHQSLKPNLLFQSVEWGSKSTQIQKDYLSKEKIMRG